jgi:glycosyltransferase involved in cell wall biosynthesis
LLHNRTGKPVFPMSRGIDTELFRPERRRRTDQTLVIGFVGRLMPEKNLRLLQRVADAISASGIDDFRFQITGSGSERAWLERHLPRAEFTGVLSGEPLARAYADLDIFAFPSQTDTFGNVVQEALASGVPAVVTASGGPRFIVRDGVSGFVAASDGEFCERIVQIAREESLRLKMGRAARRQMETQSWDCVFQEVYDAYASCFACA